MKKTTMGARAPHDEFIETQAGEVKPMADENKPMTTEEKHASLRKYGIDPEQHMVIHSLRRKVKLAEEIADFIHWEYASEVGSGSGLASEGDLRRQRELREADQAMQAAVEALRRAKGNWPRRAV